MNAFYIKVCYTFRHIRKYYCVFMSFTLKCHILFAFRPPVNSYNENTYCDYDMHIFEVNIALRRFLHNHGNIATEVSPKPGLCPIIIYNDFKGSL